MTGNYGQHNGTDDIRQDSLLIDVRVAGRLLVARRLLIELNVFFHCWQRSTGGKLKLLGADVLGTEYQETAIHERDGRGYMIQNDVITSAWS